MGVLRVEDHDRGHVRDCDHVCGHVLQEPILRPGQVPSPRRPAFAAQPADGGSSCRPGDYRVAVATHKVVRATAAKQPSRSQVVRGLEARAASREWRRESMDVSMELVELEIEGLFLSCQIGVVALGGSGCDEPKVSRPRRIAVIVRCPNVVRVKGFSK